MQIKFPAQIQAKAVDHRSDIFSFGAVLCELLTGARVFHGDSLIATLAAVLPSIRSQWDLACPRRRKRLSPITGDIDLAIETIRQLNQNDPLLVDIRSDTDMESLWKEPALQPRR